MQNRANFFLVFENGLHNCSHFKISYFFHADSDVFYEKKNQKIIFYLFLRIPQMAFAAHLQYSLLIIYKNILKSHIV